MTISRRRLLQTGIAGSTALLVPSWLAAQSQQPGPPTPGVEQATVADAALPPDVSGMISPAARGKTLMVVNKLALTLGFYDVASGAREALFSLPSRPHELLVARNGRTAYVSIYGDGIYGANPHPGNQIAIIDLASRTCTGFLSTGTVWAPHGLAEGPDGTIWATCDIGASVVGFNPATRRQIAELAVGHRGAHWLCADPKTGMAFLSNRSGPGIVVMDLARRQRSGVIDTPHAVTGMALSPDGSTLFASDDQRPELLSVNTAGHTVVDSTALNGLPFSTVPHSDRERRVAASPDGRYVLVADFASAAVVRVDTATPERQKLLIVEHGPMGLAFSADGRTVWVCNHDAGTVTIVDVESMRALRDFGVGQGPETAAVIA